MPDGDRIHSQLSYHYHKAYKQICDGQFAEDTLARDVLRAMTKDIRKYGNGPINLIKEVAAQFEQLPIEPLLKATIDWNDVNRAIEKLAKQANGKTRGIDLAVKACKDFLHELRYELQYGNHSPTIKSEITKKYLWNVYRAEFEDRVPGVPQHYNNVDKGIVNARLTEMRPYIMQGLEKFVVHIVKHGNVNVLQLPRSTKPKQVIEIDSDLSQLVG